MGSASYIQTNCLGGEWSKNMQGRYDRPDYRGALNVCLNSLPIETGAWTRRPGTQFCGTTRGGVAGRLIKFDFQEISPYNMEFTNGHLRFWNGPNLVTSNDSVGVASISTANPAVVQTSAAVTWVTGDQAFFSGFGATSPLVQNRQFILTKVDTTHFSISDAVTGTAIDGSTLSWISTAGATINRILDLATPYVGGLWNQLRAVNADIPSTAGITTGSVLLRATVKPYVLTLTSEPTDTSFATFAIAPIDFHDGPYLDPVDHGALVTPSALIGVITLTIAFNAYDATRAYVIGDYVTSSSVNYRSLQDANVGHTPVSSPTFWVAVSAGEVVNGGNGFQSSDVGRLIRLYSEPPIWAVGTTYSAGNVVAYGGAGLDYTGATYWKSLSGSNTGNVPGVDLTKWALFPTGAIWTWVRITALSNIISPATGANFGDMTGGGGVAAAFDGVFTKGASTSASKGQVSSGVSFTVTSYVGKNYSLASDQAITQVAVYPSIDHGFAFCPFLYSPDQITLNLRGKSSAPSTSSDGTLLGTTGIISNTTSPLVIVSTDQVTAWKYLWVEQITTFNRFASGTGPTGTNVIAQVSFTAPTGTGTTSGVSVEIRGDALLYTSAIRTWRMGLYSDTTGYPTCGTWHEGRLWLSGFIANRWDSSKSNDPFNFAPTQPSGLVAADNGISYTFNAPDQNPIFWGEPDLQGIICGTQGGEWLLHAPTPGPMSPVNISAQRVTKTKCANIEPRRTPHTVAFVQAYRRKILEYFADIYSGKFTAQNLTETAKHLTLGFVDELAYQNELAPVVWARVDGALRGCTYKRDTPSSQARPTFAGWHRHVLGSDRVIESICVGPSVGGELDSLAMVTNDTVSNVRHVELLTNLLDEGMDAADAWYLDDAVEPSSTSIVAPYTNAPYGGLKFNGLWHLNGKTITVFAGGLDCGDWLVAAGSVTVSFGDSISGGTGSGLFTAAFVATGVRLIAGFTYTSAGQIVRPNAPAESGARSGPAFGKKRRNQKYAIEVDLSSDGLLIGTKFTNMRPVDFRSDAGTEMTPLQTASGIYKGTLEDDYSYDGMVCWRITRPLPATVIAIGAFIHSQDE